MARQLRATGGTWSWLLFENKRAGRDLGLTWTFAFDVVEEAPPPDEEPATGLTVDWVPSGTSRWEDLEGEEFVGDRFAEPIESSIYTFMHHRFDRAEVLVREQKGKHVAVSASVSGDVDFFGTEQLQVESTLKFAGIRVALDHVGNDVNAALAALAKVANLDGLHPIDMGRSVLFAPVTGKDC